MLTVPLVLIGNLPRHGGGGRKLREDWLSFSFKYLLGAVVHFKMCFNVYACEVTYRLG